MSNQRLSLDDFKRWMKDHNKESYVMDRPKNGLIGICVESKISKERLLGKMTVEKGSIEEAADLFIESGGAIEDVNDKCFSIRSGDHVFSIHRCYVKRA